MSDASLTKRIVERFFGNKRELTRARDCAKDDSRGGNYPQFRGVVSICGARRFASRFTSAGSKTLRDLSASTGSLALGSHARTYNHLSGLAFTLPPSRREEADCRILLCRLRDIASLTLVRPLIPHTLCTALPIGPV